MAYITCDQFSLGGLTPSANMLRLIEEINGDDDDQMQNSFQAYDKCSGKSISITIKIKYGKPLMFSIYNQV